ncbi:MAG: hypothetical protein RJA22_474 [Verrucomicrobiota bacterium]
MLRLSSRLIRMLRPGLPSAGLVLSLAAAAGAATPAPRWADFVETNFPFYSSVVDARRSGGGTNNLTPRALVLNLGHDYWAAFDVDLLRVAAVWRGPGLAPVSMAQGSYHTAGRKAPEGQSALPEPRGTLWLANGIYPGWQQGEAVSLSDPRAPAPDAHEVGRGPLPPDQGRFRAVRFVDDAVQLEYEAAGSRVQETWVATETAVERRLRCEPCPHDRWLVAGRLQPGRGVELRVSGAPAGNTPVVVPRADELQAVRLPASRQPVEVVLRLAPAGEAAAVPAPRPARERRPRWPEVITTRGQSNAAADALVLENIGLPLDNPWRRNVRLADLAFFPDGRAAAVTFDGDVWLVAGLADDLGNVRWRRFASGFHEPLSLVVRGERVVVCDRNGIWQLRDEDGDGEADAHELVSNAYAQTAETREFATGMRLAPDGSFILAKGGQQSSTLGRHNGTILRVPADGTPAEVLAYGLRMPFLGVHPRTGLITVSDQQGHYVPATPLHVIRDRQYYGFLSLLLPKEKYPAPIADPLTWIPHPINASGASQVWLTGARMGPFNDALIHFGYYRPEIFLVRLQERTARPQASVVSVTRDLAFPPLNGAVNPADGQLYVTGFQIWGTEAPQVSGLARVHHTGRPSTLPREVVPMREGVLLSFDVPVDPASATNLSNYSVERWNYRRTASYGSPHFKPDGSKGQDWMTPSSAYLSADGRRVFVGLPGMSPVMQLRVGWDLRLPAAGVSRHNAYGTPAELPSFAPEREGFAALTVDLTPRAALRVAETPVTAVEGRRVAELMGCLACHSTDGSTLGKVGPSWKGLFGTRRALAGGKKVLADEAYLRESIRNPSAQVAAGFDKSDTGMPSYEGVLTGAQIEALVEYVKTLGK